MGFAKKDGIYNDLEVYKDSKYIWHRITDDQWVVDNGKWLEILPAINYKALYECELKRVENIEEYIEKIDIIINKE